MNPTHIFSNSSTPSNPNTITQPLNGTMQQASPRQNATHKIVPVKATESMLLSAHEIASIGVEQARLAHSAVIASAPDVYAQPLTTQAIQDCRAQADVRVCLSPGGEPWQDHFARAIQERFAQSLGIQVQAGQATQAERTSQGSAHAWAKATSLAALP